MYKDHTYYWIVFLGTTYHEYEYDTIGVWDDLEGCFWVCGVETPYYLNSIQIATPVCLMTHERV